MYSAITYMLFSQSEQLDSAPREDSVPESNILQAYITPESYIFLLQVWWPSFAKNILATMSSRNIWKECDFLDTAVPKKYRWETE
jgi:hypothetical protein